MRILKFNSCVDQIKFQEAYLSLYQPWKHKQIGQLFIVLLVFWNGISDWK